RSEHRPEEGAARRRARQDRAPPVPHDQRHPPAVPVRRPHRGRRAGAGAPRRAEEDRGPGMTARGLLARVQKLKISAKVSATAVVIVVFQGVLSLIGVSILITQTNLASFRGQLARTTHSVQSFIDSTK